MNPPSGSPSSEPAHVEQVFPSPSVDREAPGEFFVVGIAASAGGLTAISEILTRLPHQPNLAVVVVQHLDPHHDSILVDLLGRVTSTPVQWVADGQAVEPGQLYVAPAHASVEVDGGIFRLAAPSRRAPSGDADFFFQSLAGAYKHRAVAVIVSGNGSDGAAGAKAIKEAGGIVVAQDPATAEFPSMPRAAIDAGCADRVLTPVGIAEELVKLTQSASSLWNRIAAEDSASGATEAEQLAAIFRLLATRTGVNFGDYKQSTIKRRLARQMMLAKVSELGDYVKLLQKDPEELERLYDSLLINVTEFFRDPEYFDFLRTHIVPDLLKRRGENAPLRIWVPGCSTGEEVYSLGILIREVIEERGERVPVQIFGTDVSDRAVSHARAGRFATADVANVSPERLKRFFYKTERGYMIAKPIRDLCVFARQNVTRDSPFSRLDLISCRNLLIYLSPKLQRKVMPIFHYALNPGGYLMLGNSESIGPHADLYRLVDRHFRIYARKPSTRRTHFELSLDHPATGGTSSPRPFSLMPDDLKEPFDVFREADRIVLNRYGPIGVLINGELEILQFRGDISPYLAPVAGRASLHLLTMAREGLASELEAAMREVREKNARVQRSVVPMLHGETTSFVDIDVTPIDATHTKERFYLVLFTPSVARDDQAQAGVAKPEGSKPGGAAQIEKLREDLQATRNYLQATIEKHEATNQELRAANEEIQSSNEELQSTNEELETAKEELQSTNEELTTVNEELHSRQVELMQLNNDLNNLINSVHLPIIILGQDMRIRRFTPMAEKVLNVIPSDIGRPLSDINTNLNLSNLPQLMHEVIDSLIIKELEVQDNHGRWYSMRLRPYKTTDNKIDGVVATLIDIDQMKRTIAQVEEARDFAQAVIESTSEPLAVLTTELRISVANDAFAAFFHTTVDGIQGRPLAEVARDHSTAKKLRTILEGILPTNGRLTDYPLQLDISGLGPTQVFVNARQIARGTRSYPLIVLSFRFVR